MDSTSLSRSRQTHAEAILRTRGLLANVPHELQDRLLALGQWRRVAPRAVLFNAGDERGTLQAVASGYVAFESSVNGSAMTLVDVQHGPFWIAGQPLIDGSMRQISAVARSELEVLVLPAGTFARLTSADMRYFPIALGIPAGLFWTAMTALTDSLVPDSRLRCIAALLRISGLRNPPPENAVEAQVTIPISHNDLSQLCNLSRQTSGDVLRGLAAEGLVALGYRSITIMAPAQLRTMLDDR